MKLFGSPPLIIGVQSIHTTVTAKADRLCECQAQLQKPKKPPFFCTDKHDTAALRTRQHFSSSRRYLDKLARTLPPETDLTSRKNRERTDREREERERSGGGNLVDSTRDNPGLGAARSNDDKGVR